MPTGRIYPGICGDGIFTNFLFLSHNFCSVNVGKPIKGSKDSDDSLDSKKNVSHKIARWVSSQGPVKLAENSKTCSHCDVT